MGDCKGVDSLSWNSPHNLLLSLHVQYTHLLVLQIREERMSVLRVNHQYQSLFSEALTSTNKRCLTFEHCGSYTFFYTILNELQVTLPISRKTVSYHAHKAQRLK